MPEPIPEGTPLACPKCGSQAAVVERVLGTLDWGLAVVGHDGVVRPAKHKEPPAVMADNASPVGVWAVCDARACGHQWKLRRRFDPAVSPDGEPNA